MKFNSIDIFSGCGGLSAGLYKAGFDIKAALEINEDATRTYAMNFNKTYILQQDIRKVKISNLRGKLKNEPLHLLAGCPPCQGFSSVRRLNGSNKKDERNDLILQYLRLVKALKPYTIMMENVPGLLKYYKFKVMLKELKRLGYKIEVKIVNVKDYGVPQRRRRLVLVGSKFGEINVATGKFKQKTVRDTIGKIEPTSFTKDPIHKIYPSHSKRIKRMIKKIPKDGGSRKDLSKWYELDCHNKVNVGFNDVYGRLRWDDYSTTITGGCLNPSKGRFLHPTKNRTITAREAALLQSFPPNYKFPEDISITSLSLLIGNALPPKFSYIQCKNIRHHLEKYLI
jgi:DNA (cytosine-5)-methyltransferase 1